MTINFAKYQKETEQRLSKIESDLRAIDRHTQGLLDNAELRIENVSNVGKPFVKIKECISHNYFDLINRIKTNLNLAMYNNPELIEKLIEYVKNAWDATESTVNILLAPYLPKEDDIKLS